MLCKWLQRDAFHSLGVATKSHGSGLRLKVACDSLAAVYCWCGLRNDGVTNIPETGYSCPAPSDRFFAIELRILIRMRPPRPRKSPCMGQMPSLAVTL